MWRSFADVARDRLHGRPLPEPVHDERWPAHLHIDLLPGIRGRGVGAALLRRWLARLDDAGVAGCHVQTLAENAPAVAAFQSVGFERRGDPVVVPGLRTRRGDRHHVQLLARPGSAVS